MRFRDQTTVIALFLIPIISLVACGGGGGGTNSDAEKVTISGVVDAGGDNASIPNANCRYIDSDGQTLDTDVSGQDGNYLLSIPAGVQGDIYCSPQSMPNLNLSTFVSTIGLGAGSRLDSENITPSTTIAADIIRHENPPDPETRKAELLVAIATGQDPDLELVVALSERLYRAMLSQQINASFGDDRNSGGNGGDGGDGDDNDSEGGISGEAGDGADFSPLQAAECSFLVGNEFETAEQISKAALADFLDDGELDRPDLSVLADSVLDGLTYSSEEIQQAFTIWFPNGLGEELSSITNDEGEYFLPIPPNLPGYVRCTPQNQQKLVLGTYVPGRQTNVVLEDQDVTPATTVYNTIIAPRLVGNLDTTKENYLADINGLETQLIQQPDGTLSGFQLSQDTEPRNSDVGLVAFSATALFNAFYKNGLDIDFPTAIVDLTENLMVDTTFLEEQGVPAGQIEELAGMVNRSINETAGQLNTDLGSALTTARLNVKVTAAEDGSAVEGVVVNIEGSSDCENCGAQTTSDGIVLLTLRGLTESATDIVVTVLGGSDYEDVRTTVTAVALSTVDVDVSLSDRIVYDDFSSNQLDTEKWGPDLSDNATIEIIDGKCSLELQTDPYETGNSGTVFNNPEGIEYIETKGVLKAITVPENGAAYLRVVGSFYSDGSDTDIWASIRLIGYYDANQLIAECSVYRKYSDRSEDIIASYDFGTIDLDEEYTLSINYNGDNSFKFGFNDQYFSITGPTRVGNPLNTVDIRKRIGLRINGGDTPGSIAGEIDNVYINRN